MAGNGSTFAGTTATTKIELTGQITLHVRSRQVALTRLPSFGWPGPHAPRPARILGLFTRHVVARAYPPRLGDGGTVSAVARQGAAFGAGLDP
jgi:hypothetical protein